MPGLRYSARRKAASRFSPYVLVIICSIKIITCVLQIPRGAGFLRGRTLPTQQTRLSDKLFTVDIAKSGGKIAPIRIPLQQVWLYLPPDSGWGRLEFCLGEKMNKADLVDRIAGACDMSKTQATAAIDTAVDSITAALKKGDRVALIGFGTFSVSQRKARNGRNPQTGATIKIAARRVAKFTPGAELKKAVNRK